MRWSSNRVRRWFAWRPVFVQDLDQWVWWEHVWKVKGWISIGYYFADEDQAKRAARFWAPKRY